MDRMNILEENVTPLEKILSKTVNNLTLKETLSLVIYAAKNLANDVDFSDNKMWKDLYQEFEQDLVKQNDKGWPNLLIVKNDYGRRIDIFCTGTYYINSNNLLMLLLRILFVENYKRKYIYKSYNYHNVLGHKLNDRPNKPVTKISLVELFELLQCQLQYYLKVYDDDDHYENCLGTKIVSHLSTIIGI